MRPTTTVPPTPSTSSARAARAPPTWPPPLSSGTETSTPSTTPPSGIHPAPSRRFPRRSTCRPSPAGGPPELPGHGLGPTCHPWWERCQPRLAPTPIPEPPRTRRSRTRSAGDAVHLAPAGQDVERPDPRPVQARPLVAERLPEPLHWLGPEADAPEGFAIPQRLVDRPAQAFADPPVEGKDEAALGALEKARVESPQAGPAKRCLAKYGLIPERIR